MGLLIGRLHLVLLLEVKKLLLLLVTMLLHDLDLKLTSWDDLKLKFHIALPVYPLLLSHLSDIPDEVGVYC